MCIFCQIRVCYIYHFSDILCTGDRSPEDTIVLFPSDIALSFPDWYNSKKSNSIEESHETKGTERLVDDDIRQPLTVIVVDAVWRHARRMALRLRDLLPTTKHVQLTPEQMSVYMRKQSQPDRICTVEATALFLQQFGESAETTEAMVESVRVNNRALKPVSTKRKHESEATSL